jgi:hypothetical protein
VCSFYVLGNLKQKLIQLTILSEGFTQEARHSEHYSQNTTCHWEMCFNTKARISLLWCVQYACGKTLNADRLSFIFALEQCTLTSES